MCLRNAAARKPRAKPELGYTFLNLNDADMARQRNTILVLGESSTVFYCFRSLGDAFWGQAVKPDYPKHANLSELKATAT